MSRLIHIALCLLYLIIFGAHAQSFFPVFSSADAGVGTLRQAITDANVVSSAVVISFAFSTPQTITLSSPLPIITRSDLTITGPGANLVTISGNNVVQVFLIGNGVTNIAMSGLTIANGFSEMLSGGGGCIQNNGQLSLTGCVISQCTSEFNALGGGVYNAGTLAVDSCTFSGNTAGSGGAIYSETASGSSLTVSRSTFTANFANGGDAISINGGVSATITDSTFYNNGKSANGHAAIVSSGDTISIQRCTITANYGDAGFSGGLYVYAGTTTIENNIIYGNLGTGADVRLNTATIIDNGYNIIGTSIGFTPTSTTLNVDPLLGPLSDNGGPTPTCALGATSPAINAANPALTRTTDQRGFPQVGQRDIGAFEVQSGTGGGDPSFVGFMGQKFGFHGKPNKSFHIFSDPYITINSRFAVANPSKGKGTVMQAFGIRWENHTITFGVESASKNNTALLISIDGIERLLPRSNQATQLDDCINTTWSFPKFRINTPLHKIVIDWRSEHTDHINGSYLNIRIDAPLDNPSLCGGVLGQTASTKNVKSLSKKDSDFITSDDMLSIEAKTSKFSAHPLLCVAVSTQPPATAAVAHEHSAANDLPHVTRGMRV